MEAKKVNGSDVIADMTAGDAMVIYACLMAGMQSFTNQFGDDAEMMSSLFDLLDKTGCAVVDISKKNGEDEKSINEIVAQLELFRALGNLHKAKH